MTKARAPLTFAQAMSRAMGVIAVADIATLLNRSQKWVYDCSNPDHPRLPTVGQALEVDAAFIAAGGAGAPFQETFTALLDQQAVASLTDRDALAVDLAEASEECGQAISASIALVSPSAGQNAAGHALVEIEQGMGALSRLQRRIKGLAEARERLGA